MRLDTEEQEGPVWDPVQQIYVGGVPENAAVKNMIENNGGVLTLFGYGSLCWNPGNGALAHPSVTHRPGKAQQYRRCWSQKSTDHRGNTQFQGIVCTLLKDSEFRQHSTRSLTSPCFTEGLLYRVPPEIVDQCLAELDFREKGGYARDIIEVVDDSTGNVEQALLYRGTPDNPAFWPRALWDLSYAAAVMAVASGPSGANHVYLDQLDSFLASTPNADSLHAFDDTQELALASQSYRKHDLHFFSACGSNQHNQLRLDSFKAGLVGGEDTHQLCESYVCLSKSVDFRKCQSLHAGGGHTGMLMEDGSFFLFGWNRCGQLGRQDPVNHSESISPIKPLKDILVDSCSLGFEHTLVIERSTKRVVSFGDNSKGQVGHNEGRPKTPLALASVRAIQVSAGVFHSAAIDDEGTLYTFGMSKFGQVLDKPWKPNDGAKVIDVVCGRHHTVALDDQGRVWTFGDNKFKQLGKSLNSRSSSIPILVHGPWEAEEPCSLRLRSGWSHTIVVSGDKMVYGWGRNDKGQLGTNSNEHVDEPRLLFADVDIVDVQCASESTVVIDTSENIWACGWNEHGNLGSGDNKDKHSLCCMTGAAPTLTPGYPEESMLRVACGGAHVIAMKLIA